MSSLFFRVCIEISVERYVKLKGNAAVPPMLAYQAVDAYARLIVLLIRTFNDPNPNVNASAARLNLTTKILSIIVLVLVHMHEQQRHTFNQKPFFRLFATLLHDLHINEMQLQSIYFQILSAMRYANATLKQSF